MADYFPILDLPKEILLKEIMNYFNFLDIKNFRLVCKKFRDLSLSIFSGKSYWKQFIPYELLLRDFPFEEEYKKLSISTPPIERICVVVSKLKIQLRILQKYHIKYLDITVTKFLTTKKLNKLYKIVRALPELQTLNYHNLYRLDREFWEIFMTQFPKLKIKFGTKETTFSKACHAKILPLIKDILKKDKSMINYLCGQFTPLMLAAETDNVNMAIELLKYGADVNFYNPHYHYSNPLMFSIALNSVGTTIELLKYGADINFRNFHLNAITPLMYAIKYKDIDIIKILLKYNPDIYLLDNNKRNAIDYAKETKNQEIINIINNHAEKLLTNN